jgi:phosphoglycerate dehydrogenase-like enzyme
VITTPHVGYTTEGTFRGWYADVVEDIAAYRAGKPIRNLT